MKITTGLVIGLLLLVSCGSDKSDEGDRFYRKGQYEKAIESYSEYLVLNPTDLKSLYNRGRAYQEVGKDDKATEDFNRVIKEDPLNVNALLSIANDYYYRIHDYENAIFYSDKVLKISPNAMAFTLRGQSFQRLGKLNEAMRAYNDAISTNDTYADAYISRGSLFIYLSQTQRACTDFKQAKALDADVENYISKYCK
jgi:tetratricopeptide (TPR) repeat protein